MKKTSAPISRGMPASMESTTHMDFWVSPQFDGGSTTRFQWAILLTAGYLTVVGLVIWQALEVLHKGAHIYLGRDVLVGCAGLCSVLPTVYWWLASGWFMTYLSAITDDRERTRQLEWFKMNADWARYFWGGIVATLTAVVFNLAKGN